MNYKEFPQSEGRQEEEGPKAPGLEEVSEGELEQEETPTSVEPREYRRQKLIEYGGPKELSGEDFIELAKGKFGIPEGVPGGFEEEARDGQRGNRPSNSILDFTSASAARRALRVVNDATQPKREGGL